MEYERKFRLERLPEDVGPSVMIRQVYWRLGNGWVLRLRRTGDSTRLDDELALKGPRDDNKRPELEWRLRDAKKPPTGAELISAAVQLFGAGSAHQIVKTRHNYLSADGYPFDIDEFHHANAGLIIAEIEMPSARELAAVVEPGFSVEEVSNDARFQNESLAFHPWDRWRPGPRPH